MRYNEIKHKWNLASVMDTGNMLYQGIQHACRILLESGMGMTSFPLKCLTGNDPNALSDKLFRLSLLSILRGVNRSFVTGVLGRPVGPHLQESSSKRRISLLYCLTLIMVPIHFLTTLINY